jgi:hypothetical protein
MSNYNSLIQMRDTIIDYLEKEKSINEDALKAYEPQVIPEDNEAIRVMREKERIKINDRVYELKRHIEVIKRMYPSE